MSADEALTFLGGIVNGKYDTYLDQILNTVRDRKKALTPKASDYFVGQSVVFSTEANPKYLIGHPAKIVKVNPVKVVVELDKPVGKFRGRISTPTVMIQPA